MSSSFPSVAIVVRTAGRAPVFLRRALDSIRRQTVAPTELIIINAGGDATAVEDAVRASGLPEVSVIVRHESRLAQPVAANRGVAATRADWVTFLDDDDTWSPLFLESVVRVIQQEAGAADFGGVVTQTVAVQEKLVSGAIRELKRKPFNPMLHAVDLAQLVSANQFTNNALVFSRSAFEGAGRFREDLPVLYDWEFNVRLAARLRLECVPEALACYHLRPAHDGAANSSREEMDRVAVQIRNEWLRADLSAGRLGLGQLCVAGETVGMGRILAGLGRLKARVRRWRSSGMRPN